LTLTGLAVRLIGIAFRARGRLLQPPCRWGAAKSSAEGVGKSLRRAETHGQCDLQYAEPGLCHQTRRRNFAPSPSQVAAECFPHPRGEQSMEVKRRKMGDLRQALKVQVLIEMLIDVLDYPMHAVDIYITAVERAHRFGVAGP
jgi:hypothetical protein